MYLLIAKISKEKSVTTFPKMPQFVVLLSLLQVFGSILFNYAISKGQTSVVAPIAGSSPAVFVALAFFLFHERLNKKQWTGIVAAVIGIVGLSIVSG